MSVDLSEAVLQRALSKVTPSQKQERPAPQSREINPTLLAILGALADGASTATLLKKGHREDNPLYAPLRGKPAATGAAVAGTGLAAVGLGKLIGKKFPGAAKALTANYAAQSIGLAGKNFEQTQNGVFGESSADAYRSAVMRGLQRSQE
jgi:hypothetical protein